MTLRTMRASFLFLGVSGAVLMHGPSAAWAQRAEPLPYSDDERDRARNEEDARDESMERPSRPQRREREETDPNEAREREYGVGERRRTYFREDDPHLGLGAELLGGLMLLDRSSGSADAELGYGLRALWEVGRLLSDERLREALFVDLTWLTASTRGGTEQVNASTQVHYFTVAPAYLFRFDGEGRWGAYLQLGGGAAYVRSRFNYGGGTTRIGTVAPLLQYGGGFRVRLGLNDSGTARLMLRLEVTRFRRDYLNDTYLGLGLGAAL